MPTSKVNPTRSVVLRATASKFRKVSAKKRSAGKTKIRNSANARTGLSRKARKPASTEARSASERIDKRIALLADWRGKTLSRMRKLIKEADPDVVEEWKWMGNPVWSHEGIICTGESYKSIVKLTFAKGASLKDPAKLFNSSLDGNVRRAIDIHDGEQLDADAFKALVHAAVALNTARGKAKPRRAE